jgi:hypothetical protein
VIHGLLVISMSMVAGFVLFGLAVIFVAVT